MSNVLDAIASGFSLLTDLMKYPCMVERCLRFVDEVAILLDKFVLIDCIGVHFLVKLAGKFDFRKLFDVFMARNAKPAIFVCWYCK